MGKVGSPERWSEARKRIRTFPSRPYTEKAAEFSTAPLDTNSLARCLGGAGSSVWSSEGQILTRAMAFSFHCILPFLFAVWQWRWPCNGLALR